MVPCLVEVISVKATKVLWGIIITHLIYWPCPVGNDIVFRFIIKYSSLRDFGP